MSMHHGASCVFCDNPKFLYADKSQWMRHLAGHREKIIAHIVDNFERCPLGAYPRLIQNKTEYAGHLKWSHQKRELLEWAYKNLIENQISVLP
ncbi:hypothetical protein [Candidatus Nitrosotenuis aquarius]|uniref:hypothetical protein n=1 Tax=Candidatus Nitrosotenuis aquarius TaxID=1846278 RepID=UPI0013C2C991|nr:hypothetical protein [Candidatus Nitrosotenuis aquarius]